MHISQNYIVLGEKWKEKNGRFKKYARTHENFKLQREKIDFNNFQLQKLCIQVRNEKIISNQIGLTVPFGNFKKKNWPQYFGFAVQFLVPRLVSSNFVSNFLDFVKMFGGSCQNRTPHCKFTQDYLNQNFDGLHKFTKNLNFSNMNVDNRCFLDWNLKFS